MDTPSVILLMEEGSDGELHTVQISKKAWELYWKKLGKTGPKNGWDIPTSKEIEKVVGFY